MPCETKASPDSIKVSRGLRVAKDPTLSLKWEVMRLVVMPLVLVEPMVSVDYYVYSHRIEYFFAHLNLRKQSERF
jgi:hypothetical protein